MSEQTPEQTPEQTTDTTPEDGEQSNREQHQDQGVLGDTAPPDDEFAPKTVADAAADQDLEQNEAGYIGTLPDADNRPDLSVAGVTGQNDKAAADDESTEG